MHALTVLPLPLIVKGVVFVWWIEALGGRWRPAGRRPQPEASGRVNLHAADDFTAWIEARGYSLDAGIIGVEITPEDAVEWKIRWV